MKFIAIALVAITSFTLEVDRVDNQPVEEDSRIYVLPPITAGAIDAIPNTVTELPVEIDVHGPKQEASFIKQAEQSPEEGVLDKKKLTTPTSSLVTEQEESSLAEGTKAVEKTLSADGYLDDLEAILHKYVDGKGNVDYAGLKAVSAEVDELAKNIRAAYSSSMSDKEGLAYWINAYNLHTIKLIIDNYPVASITDLDGGKPWDRQWIEIDGKSYSLNNIEHDIIRPVYGDARIHFAVNCAATSCPPLLNAAYKPSTLDQQLEAQTKKFINNSAYNTVSSDKLVLSKIFDWYKEDFADVGIIDYVDRYTSTDVASDASVSYREYDWALNKQ